MRSFSSQFDYPVAPSAVVRLWCDPAFLEAVGRKYGGVGEPTVTPVGATVRVETERALPMDAIPSFVKRFIKDGTLRQVDVWPAVGDDAASEKPVAETTAEPLEGTWTVEGKMPAKMSGRQSVTPTDTGCRVDVNGTIDVSAPLVAGKIEELISREITKLIGVQQEFAARWLAGDRP